MQIGAIPLKSPRPIIGLLGGICAGKTYVAARIAELGPGYAIDADDLAHDALDACARDGRLVDLLGPEFVEDGVPNREKIAGVVFNDAAKLRRLERLIHPYCFAKIKGAIQDHRRGDGPPVLVLDVALLIEVGLDRHCDALWFIDVPEAVRAKRAEGRGISMEDIQRRERFQSPMARKKARADLVINNNVSSEELDAQVRAGLDAIGVSPATVPPGGTSAG